MRTIGFTRDRSGAVRLRLPADEVRVLSSLVAELRAIIDDPRRFGDDVAARLRPSAIPDDFIEDAEYQLLVGPNLTAEWTRSADVVAEMLGVGLGDRGEVDHVVDEEQADAWMLALNHLRVAIGTAIGVTEEDDVDSDSLDDDRRVYHWLSYMLETLVEAVAG